MNIALWIAQGLLTAMYLTVGSMKVFQPAKVHAMPQMTLAHGQPDNHIRFVGTTEVLCALGLILPLVTGILPWLPFWRELDSCWSSCWQSSNSI